MAMNDSDIINSLRLFNEKAEKLDRLSFVETIRKYNSGFSIKIRKREDDLYDLIQERRGPLEEAIDAFVLTIRFFIQDNESISFKNIASLYEAFEPADARRLAEKLEIHYTPKHGSWLNMAEIELSVLSRQCMNDYFECIEDLTAAIAAWENSRNQTESGINWQFTTDDARIKLKKLYPSV